MKYRRSLTVLDARAAQYKKETAEIGRSDLRIGKDALNRLHAYLIPWTELDALSARESAVTGTPIRYRQMDRDNVIMIPQMLRAAEED